ncbi:MAG: N-glycosylase/DNA lyase [Desulfurococcaceae archaeon TW002]
MSVYVINEERVKAVSSVFKSLGLEGCEEFVRVDPQYVSLSKLQRFCGEISVELAAINSLVSYMLSMKGEEFWNLFTDFTMSRCSEVRDLRGAVELVKEFTRNYNKLYLGVKMKRLDKVLKCADAFKSLRLGQIKEYLSKLSLCIDAEKESKTVVFSVKMAYYVLRSTKADANLSKISIPVDRRVALVTLTSGLLSPTRRTIKTFIELENLAEELLKHPKNVRIVWDIVSEESGIPALLIDTPLWLIGGYVKTSKASEIVKNLVNLGLLIDESLLTRLVSELTYILRTKLSPL